MISVLAFFQWCEQSSLGAALRDSRWLFPVVESVHLLTLALIGGAVLLVDMRLLGLGGKGQPVVGELARDVEPWLVGGLVVMLTSGVVLFASEALKLYYSGAFWSKMTFLGLAILFTFTVRRWVTRSPDGQIAPVWMKVTGLMSTALWLGVGSAGRWIAFG
jgi:hypothetical protein